MHFPRNSEPDFFISRCHHPFNGILASLPLTSQLLPGHLNGTPSTYAHRRRLLNCVVVGSRLDILGERNLLILLQQGYLRDL